MQINNTLSYPITEISPFGFHFTTEQSVTYFCLFRDVTFLTPILGVYDIHVFEFQFFQSPSAPPVLHTKRTPDSRIAHTIVNILQSFFEVKDRIVLYLCDSSDGKHKARLRLFESWHQSLSNNTTSISVVLSKMIEGCYYEMYGCVMYSNDFEQEKLIQDYLIDKALDILTEKYES